MNTMDTLAKFKQHLRPGQVLRRADLAKYSPSVDKHLQQLVSEGSLRKVSSGIYYSPVVSRFGTLPPDEEKLVKAFLKDSNFYVSSLNAYNALGVGATQLYNQKLVYNSKRDGLHVLDGRRYFFLKNRKFPKKTSKEFLMVDLVNNMRMLAEDSEELKRKLASLIPSLDREGLEKAIKAYAGSRTKVFFYELLGGL